MKLSFQKFLLPLALILMLAMLACSAPRKGGVSMPHKKKQRKCDCPRWTVIPAEKSVYFSKDGRS